MLGIVKQPNGSITYQVDQTDMSRRVDCVDYVDYYQPPVVPKLPPRKRKPAFESWMQTHGRHVERIVVLAHEALRNMRHNGFVVSLDTERFEQDLVDYLYMTFDYAVM